MKSPTIFKYLLVNTGPAPAALDAEADESVHGLLNSFSACSSISFSRASEKVCKRQRLLENNKIRDLLKTVK